MKKLIYLAIVTGALVCLTPQNSTPVSVNVERNYFQEELLSEVFGFVPTRKYSTPVTVTAYSAEARQTDSTPHLTADMTLSRVGLLAVSRDILNELNLEYGETVILGDFGVFQVRDTMNKRFSRRVDILMGNRQAALEFGKHKNITLTWVR